MIGGVLDLGELVKRAIKYLVEGALVALAAYAIPQRKLNLDEIGLIALVAAATFSILDTYVPTLAVSARSGAGFGLAAPFRSREGGALGHHGTDQTGRGQGVDDTLITDGMRLRDTGKDGR